ncbi:hypothetical protein CO019_01015 [Candidatus Berkelbacteria bacterium CG_4_9_14_0_2_um_filter_42_30]|uniref:Uncharacterized protein n=2 Tax=Candidatus Berkelbacteria TaxID=1618330 RepID=A0A1J4RS01_9BACT|nr:MAG: hypothetical protein AUJ40_02460 [Candidatus Berkelbacteria bacterium CG1_02_42_45]PJC65750.1 MAG: hypothetical protein CO019_01015 [Candidatus Berkelbacteria bacterium CG_4_9_14_0_2_um_filter_42_30]
MPTNIQKRCPCYGFGFAVRTRVLTPSWGNQCALYIGEARPCQMEIQGQAPDWGKCPLNAGAICRQTFGRWCQEAVTVIAPEHPEGIQFREWVEIVLAQNPSERYK